MALLGACEKTGRGDRKDDVKEVKDLREVKEKGGSKDWRRIPAGAKQRAGYRRQSHYGGVIDFCREQADRTTGGKFEWRRFAAGRQVHLAPVCDAGSAG